MIYHNRLCILRACCLALTLIQVYPHRAATDSLEDVTSYAIPENAIKSGAQTTRYFNKTLYTYFLPDGDGKRGPVVGREYYEKLLLVERDLYKDDRKHGYQTEWYPNGRMKKRETFNKGVRDGTLDYWDEAGDLVGHTVFKDGTGWRRVYNSDGVMTLEEQYSRNMHNGISMEYFPISAVRSIVWEIDNRLTGPGYSFYNDDQMRGVTYFSRSSIYNPWSGPAIQYPRPASSPTDSLPRENTDHETLMGKSIARWAINGREVTEAQYAAAAALDHTLPPYFADPNAYKKLVDAETLKALQRYRTMPRVKIPLEIDKQGNPVAAKIQAAPDVKKDEH